MIYIITHKSFSEYFTDKEHYRILHVGSNANMEADYILDSTGDNISEKNPNYCELTGLYWIWKNAAENLDDIMGLVHYRRYFTTAVGDLLYTYLGIKPRVLDYEKIETALRERDIILPVPIKIFRTTYQFYDEIHNGEDLLITRKSIERLCPEYLKAFDAVMNSHKFYYGNMMICRKKVLDEYCKWLFDILSDVEQKIDIEKYSDDYQKRVYGFLSERLLQVWVVHKNLKVAEYPAFNTESPRLTIFGKNYNRLKKVLSKVWNH